MFKPRSAGPAASAPAQPLTIESLRRRARHRLIGASVLVLVAVIGFPLLFDAQPRPLPVDLPIDIPSRQAPPALAVAQGKLHTPEVEVPETVVPNPPALAQASESRAEPAPVPATPVALPTPQPVPTPEPKPEQKLEQKPQSKPESKSESKPATTAADAVRAQALLEGQVAPKVAVRVVVQVGAFADSARAQEVRQRLERAGLKTYTHVAETAEGKRTRVRVGPFDSRAEADKAAQKVKALGLSANVLTL